MALSFTSYAVTKNDLTAAVIKDKIDYALGNKTNGLHEVTLSESLAAGKDTKSTVNFLRCSTSKNTFRFVSDCNNKRIGGKMTIESLAVIKVEMSQH